MTTRPDYIHKVEIVGKMVKQKPAIAWNDPCEDGYEIIVFLENFHFRKNQNIEKVAWRLNYYFLIELICAMSRVEGLHDGEGEWCSRQCYPLKATEEMGFYYGFKAKS